MFNNIGKKLKTVAKIICWVGIIASVLSGIALMTRGGVLTATGLATAVGGALFSWIGSLGLYGFGELVENSDIRTNIAVKQEMEREQNKEK